MTTLSDAINLVLHIAAARKDATPEQTSRLINEVLPLMKRRYVKHGDERIVRLLIQNIMGPDWNPDPEYRLKD